MDEDIREICWVNMVNDPGYRWLSDTLDYRNILRALVKTALPLEKEDIRHNIKLLSQQIYNYNRREKRAQRKASQRYTEMVERMNRIQ